MIKILFVCLGNICRSPLAEAQFNHLVAKKGLSAYFHADSAGTASYHVGKAPDERSVKVALDNQVVVSHQGRQLCNEDFYHYDYILVMDSANYYDVMEVLPQNSSSQVMYLRLYDKQANGARDVPDPYYGSVTDFEQVFTYIAGSVEGFLEFLLKQHPVQNK